MKKGRSVMSRFRFREPVPAVPVLEPEPRNRKNLETIWNRNRGTEKFSEPFRTGTAEPKRLRNRHLIFAKICNFTGQKLIEMSFFIIILLKNQCLHTKILNFKKIFLKIVRTANFLVLFGTGTVEPKKIKTI